MRFVVIRLLALIVAIMLLAPASAASLAGVSEMLANYLAGNFTAMEDRAEALMISLPVETGRDSDLARRAERFVAVSVAATLAEAFEPAAALIPSARNLSRRLTGTGNQALAYAIAFADAFNQHRRGRPLAALSILDPILAGTPAADAEAAKWLAIMRALAANARSSIGEHRLARAQAREAWLEASDRLGRNHPFTIMARLWLIEALVAASDPRGEVEIGNMLDDLQPRMADLSIVGILLTHMALAFSATDEVEPMTRMVFDRALATVRPDHTITALGLEDLAYAAWWRGDYANEIEKLRAALGIYRDTLDPAAPVIGETIMKMAMANLGHAPDAIELAQISLEITRVGTGPSSYVTATRMIEAATIHSLAMQPEKALAFIRGAKRLMARHSEAVWWMMPIALPIQEAKALMAAGRPGEAAAILSGVLLALANTAWADGLAVNGAQADMALALNKAGDNAAALRAAREALKGLTAMRAVGANSRADRIGRSDSGSSVLSPFGLAALILIRSAWAEANPHESR